MEKDAFEKIASMILELVDQKWTPLKQAKWREEFLNECNQLNLPVFIQMTRERLHSSVVIACQKAGVYYQDILTAPGFSPAVFYVENLHHIKYCPLDITPVDIFL